MIMLIVLSAVAFGFVAWAKPNNNAGIRTAMTVAQRGPIALQLNPSARFLMGYPRQVTSSPTATERTAMKPTRMVAAKGWPGAVAKAPVTLTHPIASFR